MAYGIFSGSKQVGVLRKGAVGPLLHLPCLRRSRQGPLRAPTVRCGIGELQCAANEQRDRDLLAHGQT